MNNRFIYLFLLLIITSPLKSEWDISGSVTPSILTRISDGSRIDLPFKIAQMESRWAHNSIEFKLWSTIEHRWDTQKSAPEIQETYFVWYPSWGEVKIGKQIHNWGAVDNNNPTDNLNAYDYYYLFQSGKKRKIGSFSASAKMYRGAWQGEIVYIPEHTPNRYPFGEEDFPISMEDPGDFLKDPKTIPEFGLRSQYALNRGDVGVTFISARDRGFSHVGLELNSTPPFPIFSYRKTTMLGLDGTLLFEKFTARLETALFKTENDYNTTLPTLDNATYLQYALQFEYKFENDVNIFAQFVGNEVVDIKGKKYILVPFTSVEMTEDDLQMGMGTPFAMFTDSGLFLSSSGQFFDQKFEAKLNTFLDLKETQRMVGLSVDYSPFENWKMTGSLSKFFGEEGTIFKEMEDFSHTSLGLNFYF